MYGMYNCNAQDLIQKAERSCRLVLDALFHDRNKKILVKCITNVIQNKISIEQSSQQVVILTETHNCTRNQEESAEDVVAGIDEAILKYVKHSGIIEDR